MTAFLRRQGLRGDEVNDVVSAAYVIAIEKLRDLPGDHDAALGWVCRTAWYLHRNLQRARVRQSSLLGRVVANVTQQSRPMDTDRIEMAAAWASLNPNERRVLTQSALGASLDDLAKLLGCGRGAAAMRLSRARLRLASAISVSA